MTTEGGGGNPALGGKDSYLDGVVVSKVNFSNQHLRLLQAPSSLMKYKNETNVRSHISQYHRYRKLPLKYQPRIRQITSSKSSEDPLVFEEEADQKKKQNKKTGIF